MLKLGMYSKLNTINNRTGSISTQCGKRSSGWRQRWKSVMRTSGESILVLLLHGLNDLINESLNSGDRDGN
jgi:hypothetical protein